MALVRPIWERIRFAHDSAGFYRRACPSCGRHFKLGPPLAEDWAATAVFVAALRHANGDELRSPPLRYCPYCGHSAAADRFLTKAQRDYVEARARHLADGMSHVTSAGRQAWDEAPGPVPEPDDMRAARLLCCADELKLKSSWTRPFFCPVCRLRHGAC
jgi:hypothetical protein